MNLIQESSHWKINNFSREKVVLQKNISAANKQNYVLGVKDGYVARNNYIYEIYDAGLTFQYTAAAAIRSSGRWLGTPRRGGRPGRGNRRPEG